MDIKGIKVVRISKKEVQQMKLPEINLEIAEKLAMETDYACFATEETNEINTADAGAFFLEGYEYARKLITPMTAKDKAKILFDQCRQMDWDEQHGWEINIKRTKEMAIRCIRQIESETDRHEYWSCVECEILKL